MHRRHLLLGSLTTLIASARPTSARGVRDFDPKAFRAAQDSRQGIVVDVYATW